MTHLTGRIPAQMPGHGRTEDRRTTVLETAWLLHQRTTELPSFPILTRDARTAVGLPPDEPVLIIFSDDVPAVAESAATAIRTSGRAYCLAPADWVAPDWLRDAPATGVLIRRVPKPPVAAVLSKTKGWLWMGPGGPGEWRLELDATQAAAARLAFLQLYWNHANDEGWPTKGTIQWRARSDAPFDLPAAMPQAMIRLTQDGARLPAPDPTSSVYSPTGQLPDGSAARVWVRPSGEGHAALATAVRQGTEVVGPN